MDLVSEYLAERQATKGTLDQSVRARSHELMAAVKILEGHEYSLETITTAQALKTFAGIRTAGFSKNYTHRTIQTFKSFLLWYCENGGVHLNEKKIRAVKSPGMDWRTKSSDDILTRDEVEAVVNACRDSRDRAIIAMLYDGSFRPGELIGLTWKDLIRDEYGIRIEFATPKTGYQRPIRLTYSLPHIYQWEQNYPGTMTPDAPLFLQTIRHSHQYGPLTKDGLAMFIRRLREKTGITKLKPSIFRPSKITHDIEEGKDLPYVMMKNWGTMKTTMVDIYAKPGWEYVDRIALESSGIMKVKRAEVKGLNPVICPKCKSLNLMGSNRCAFCGKTFTEAAALEDMEFSEYTTDPDKLIRLGQFLKKRKEQKESE